MSRALRGGRLAVTVLLSSALGGCARPPTCHETLPAVAEHARKLRDDAVVRCGDEAALLQGGQLRLLSRAEGESACEATGCAAWEYAGGRSETELCVRIPPPSSAAHGGFRKCWRIALVQAGGRWQVARSERSP